MKNLTKAGHYISSKIGKAIEDYNLIQDKDRILIAVSGGKDSLSLLHLLQERKQWAPVKFELFAAHIKTDFHCGGCMHDSVLTKIFQDLNIEYELRNIKVLDKDNKTSCFWCSWNRRKALFEIADKLKCNKIAFGHHMDDIAETILLNLFFKGEISAMNPRQELFKGLITIIRPLCYVEENKIREFALESGFPSQLCKCPNSKDSKRKYIKDFITQTEEHCPGIKTNIFRSISRIKQDYINLKEDC